MPTTPNDPAARPSSAAAELRFRMRRPQRHRLLHGYPLAAAMPAADHLGREADLALSPDRRLIVGILPHPFCNPAVTGCGFCTFPHEPGNAAKAAAVVAQAGEEILRSVWIGALSTLRKPVPVAALYFGGGTANMVEPAPFRFLCTRLDELFDLSGAEVTLEGVPAYFLRGKPLLVDVMSERLRARHFRLSMGIQTFDDARLKQMGRTAFGDVNTFGRVVELGHQRGFTVSADLLFNLPGQTLDQMKADVRRAIDLGLDHLGLYHLVLFRGLDAAWAHDEGLLDALPDNDRAAANWAELRELLLARGFVQTSLTNFERAELRGSDLRYVYEEYSFEPDRFQAVGFGPSGTSYAATADFGDAVKTLNPTSADGYVAAVRRGGRVWDRCYGYGKRDQQVFWIVRRLAALEIDRGRYRDLFGTDLLGDFPAEFEAAREAGLVEVTPAAIRPTPIGMFYSDSIATVVASERVREVAALQADGRRRQVHRQLLLDVRANSNAHGHM
jgi:oxygen-independent coproporphyrinogen-3 oxidase